MAKGLADLCLRVNTLKLDKRGSVLRDSAAGFVIPKVYAAATRVVRNVEP
jgi:hypothetical protein